MFALIVWYNIGLQHMMTVDYVPAAACNSARKEVTKLDSVEHAMCAGTPDQTVLKAFIASDCYTSGNGHDFYCGKGYVRF